MSVSGFPTAKDLFAAAREDGPARATRDEVYGKIAVATGIATGTAAVATVISLVPATTSAASAAAADALTAGSNAGAGSATAAAAGAKVAATATFGMKLLALGAVLGAASTALGVVLATHVVTPGASPTAGHMVTTVASPPSRVGTGARLAQPETRRRDPSDGATRATTRSDVTANASANANPNASANGDGDLGEEARLVTAARSALVSGDAAQALALVQATRKLRARSLEPEELGLEARALRALGRADEAAATELVLRRRYPDHALAR